MQVSALAPGGYHSFKLPTASQLQQSHSRRDDVPEAVGAGPGPVVGDLEFSNCSTHPLSVLATG